MSSVDLLYDVDIIIHVIRCFDNIHHAGYIEMFDPLRDLKYVEQEMMLKVWNNLSYPNISIIGQKDLYKLEKQLMEVEHIMRIDDTCMRSEHIQLVYMTLQKLWEFVAGEKRPKPPHESKFKMSKSLYRTKMPKSCEGTHIEIRCGKFLSYSNICYLFTGRPIRLGKWNSPEREIIRELQVRLHCSYSIALVTIYYSC
jgi:hypothetical protein